MNQPLYYEPILRFDLYTAIRDDGGWAVKQMFKNLSFIAAEVLAGVEHEDFCTSFENTGWIGTCPAWTEGRPIITLPRGCLLTTEHLGFIMEAVLS